ncbi:MAG: permease-like cell division protein FtsX [Actinomycetales bacterium]|nr:permease-like cell division protein FtsX [Actinomycetales bacterium]
MFSQLIFVSGEVWTGIRRSLTMTVAVTVTFAVSLSLLGVGVLVGAQVNEMKDFWYDKVEVSVFLCTEGSTAPTCDGETPEPERQQIEGEIRAIGVVASTTFETQQQAYARFIEQFAGSPIAENVTPEQLPASFRITLTDPQRFLDVSEALTGRAGVEAVRDQRSTFNRLFDLLNGLRLISFTFAGAMLVVTVLLVANTMRVAAFARRREVSIMRMVGASRTAIQLPFVLEAVVAAVIGSALAGIVLASIKRWVIDGVLAPSLTFTTFIGWQEVAWAAGGVAAIGLMLAIVTSLIALARYSRA